MLGTRNIIGFVPTSSREKATAFYSGVLGLKVAADDGFAVVFDANGIMLRAVSIPDFKPQYNFTILGWEVPDIEDALAELSRKGVAFEQYGLPGQDGRGIWTAPNGNRVAWFKDPDGNVLSISQH